MLLQAPSKLSSINRKNSKVFAFFCIETNLIKCCACHKFILRMFSRSCFLLDIHFQFRYFMFFSAARYVVSGSAVAYWTEIERRSQGTGDNRQSVNQNICFEGKDVYFNSSNHLFGHGGAEPYKLSQGTHRYDLSFVIPQTAPMSIEAPCGFIRYELEVTFEVPSGFNEQFKTQFNVAREEDLNNQPSLKLPSKDEEIKY